MILIAVESRTIRTRIEHLCERGGLASLGAASLDQARAALREEPITLVVLDEWFPDGNGKQLLEEIRGGSRNYVPVLSVASAADLAQPGSSRADALVLKANMTGGSGAGDSHAAQPAEKLTTSRASVI